MLKKGGIMKVNIALLISTAVTIWYFIKKWVEILSKIAEPVIKELEELAKDGVIDKKDRKKLAMKAITTLEIRGIIKLNFFSRLIINIIIDRIAKKLPDFIISSQIKEIIEEAKRS